MLILTRRVGESLHIGDEIVVSLLGVQGMQSRIGIQAPASIEVHRKEIYDRVQAERRANSARQIHIDTRVQAAAAEETFLTVVFRLPNAQAAAPLIDLLPYGRKALGTEAEVFGMTAGNLIEVQPCES